MMYDSAEKDFNHIFVRRRKTELVREEEILKVMKDSRTLASNQFFSIYPFFIIWKNRMKKISPGEEEREEDDGISWDQFLSGLLFCLEFDFDVRPFALASLLVAFLVVLLFLKKIDQDEKLNMYFIGNIQ